MCTCDQCRRKRESNTDSNTGVIVICVLLGIAVIAVLAPIVLAGVIAFALAALALGLVASLFGG
jgi:hypothetical protein